MSEASFHRLRALERLLAESLSLNLTGLERQVPPSMVTVGPKVDDADLPGRLASIRWAVERATGDTVMMSDAAVTARTRLGVALAATPSGERRRFARWPLITQCRLDLGGGSMAAVTLDIGAGGVMLAPIVGLPPGGSAFGRIALVPGDEETPCALTVDRDGVVHLGFDRLHHRGRPEGMPGAARLEEACATFNEIAFWEAATLANECEALFEVAIATETLSPEEAFGAGGHLVAPASIEKALDALLRALPERRALAYACATTRDGFVFAEHIESGATSPRRRQSFADAVTIRAAGFATGPVVQTYRRQPGREPEQVFSDVSAPVMLRGRRWGCVQIGRRLTTPDEL